MDRQTAGSPARRHQGFRSKRHGNHLSHRHHRRRNPVFPSKSATDGERIPRAQRKAVFCKARQGKTRCDSCTRLAFREDVHHAWQRGRRSSCCLGLTPPRSPCTAGVAEWHQPTTDPAFSGNRDRHGTKNRMGNPPYRLRHIYRHGSNAHARNRSSRGAVARRNPLGARRRLRSRAHPRLHGPQSQ